MEGTENIERLIKQSLEGMEVQPAIPSFGISMKKLAAAQKQRRRMIAAWWLSGMSVAVIALMVWLNYTGSSTGIASAYSNHNQDYLNEWPTVPTDTKVLSATSKNESLPPQKSTTEGSNSTNDIHDPTNPHYSQSNILYQPSPKSLLGLNKKEETSVVGRELSFIKAELMELRTVSFENTASNDTLSLLAALIPEDHSALDFNNRPQEKKQMDWFIGFGIDPQLVKQRILKNPNRISAYDYSSSSGFADLYTNGRNLNNPISLNYSGGLKIGFRYDHKWEVLAGLGLVTYAYNETQVKKDSASVPSLLTGPTTLFSATMADQSVYKNRFNYVYSSMEASRIIAMKSFDFKAGVSVSANRLISANMLMVDSYNAYSYKQRYSGNPINKWNFNAGFTFGVVKDLNSHMQVQACPNAFCNINSMFHKNYIIQQRPYGFGLDLSLLIRIR